MRGKIIWHVKRKQRSPVLWHTQVSWASEKPLARFQVTLYFSSGTLSWVQSQGYCLPSVILHDYGFSSRLTRDPESMVGRARERVLPPCPPRAPPCALSPLQPTEANSTLAAFAMKILGRIPALPRMKWVWMKISPPSSLRTRLGRHVSAPMGSAVLSCTAVFGGQGECVNSPGPQSPSF